MRRIRITAGAVTATAALNDSPTADALWKALPIEAPGHTWGEEIYFGIPVRAAQDPKASDLVELGALAYWPPGHAFCIFFGPTPASHGGECRAASAVNVVGKLDGDPKVFTRVEDGETVRIEVAE